MVQPGQVACALELSWMRANLLQAFIESGRRATQTVERKRARHIRRIHEYLRFPQGQQSEREHGLGAIYERKAFFGLQHQGLES